MSVAAHADRGNIAARVSGLRLFAEPSNIVWVIQKPFAVKANIAATKRVETNQAGLSWADGMDASGDMQWSAIRLNGCEDSPVGISRRSRHNCAAPAGHARLRRRISPITEYIRSLPFGEISGAVPTLTDRVGPAPGHEKWQSLR